MGKVNVNLAAAVSIFLFCSSALVAEGAKMKNFKIEYKKFHETVPKIDDLSVEGNASIDDEALQLTPDSLNEVVSRSHASGRVLLNKPFRLWEGKSNTSRFASFNTSFLINIYRPENLAAGEGLAFVIAPKLKDVPANSSGQYLGLTNASTDGNNTNKVVAVELDTFKQGFDPDDNHIGIDVNGIRSVAFESLTSHTITLAPIGALFYNVWVNYDGVSKLMEVFIAEQEEMDGATPPRPNLPILSASLNLMEHVSQDSYFGFAASTGNTTQLNCIRRWNLTVDYYVHEETSWLPIALGVGIPAVLLIVAVLGYYYHKRRRAISNPNLVGALRSLPGTPREFEFKDLKKATNSFDEKNKLGQGGFGEVFRGLLVKENLEIAVKRFSRESIKGQDDFLAELTIINRLRHRHLVKLLAINAGIFVV